VIERTELHGLLVSLVDFFMKSSLRVSVSIYRQYGREICFRARYPIPGLGQEPKLTTIYLPLTLGEDGALREAVKRMQEAWAARPDERPAKTLLALLEYQLALWTEQCQRHPRTLETDIRMVRELRRWAQTFGRLETLDLSPDDVDELISWCLGSRRLSPATTNLMLRTLTDHVNQLRQQQRFKLPNPFTGRQLPLQPGTKPDYSAADLDKLDRAMPSLDEQFQIYLATLRYTGARSGAVFLLTPDSVDLPRRRLQIPLNKMESYDLSIVDELFPYMVRFVELGGWKWSRNWYLVRTQRLVKKLGIHVALPGHAFRHTLATTLARKGVHPAVIAAVLGHKSLATQWGSAPARLPEAIDVLRWIGTYSDPVSSPSELESAPELC
jgi:integrase